RVRNVTGVQTCALPISICSDSDMAAERANRQNHIGIPAVPDSNEPAVNVSGYIPKGEPSQSLCIKNEIDADDQCVCGIECHVKRSEERSVARSRWYGSV